MPSITNSGKGEGLIFAQNMLIPFSNLFPKNTRLYELMTTNSEELAVILEKERVWLLNKEKSLEEPKQNDTDYSGEDEDAGKTSGAEPQENIMATAAQAALP